jgi:hypothetical protein
VTNILLAQKKKFRASQIWLISGTVICSIHTYMCDLTLLIYYIVLIVFFINNIKIHFFTSLTGVGALQGNFGTVTGVQLKLRKRPNAYIAIK